MYVRGGGGGGGGEWRAFITLRDQLVLIILIIFASKDMLQVLDGISTEQHLKICCRY